MEGAETRPRLLDDAGITLVERTVLFASDRIEGCGERFVLIGQMPGYGMDDLISFELKGLRDEQRANPVALTTVGWKHYCDYIRASVPRAATIKSPAEMPSRVYRKLKNVMVFRTARGSLFSIYEGNQVYDRHMGQLDTEATARNQASVQLAIAEALAWLHPGDETAKQSVDVIRASLGCTDYLPEIGYATRRWLAMQQEPTEDSAEKGEGAQ